MKRAATKSEAPQAISTRTKWLHARAGEVGGLLAASRCTGRCWGRVCVLPQSAERTKSSVEKQARCHAPCARIRSGFMRFASRHVRRTVEMSSEAVRDV